MSAPLQPLCRTASILTEQVYPHFTLRIGRKADGTLFGMVGGWPVPLKGLPPSIPEAYLQGSMALFLRLRLEWDRSAKRIVAKLPLVGGMMEDGAEEVAEAEKKISVADRYQEAKDYPNAVKNYREALEIKKRVLGTGSLEVGTLYYKLGLIYELQGEWDNSLDCHTRAHAIRKAALGEDHPDRLESLYQMGRIHSALSQFDKAELYLTEVVSKWEKQLGRHHDDVQKGLYALAHTLYLKRGFNEAWPHAERALQIRRQLHPSGDEETAELLTLMGHIAAEQKNFELSLSSYKEAFQITERLQIEPSDQLIMRCGHAASAHAKLQQKIDAISYYQRALQHTKRLYGNLNLKVIPPLCALASFYVDNERVDDAIARYEEALNIAAANGQPEALLPLEGMLRAQCAKKEEVRAMQFGNRVLTARKALYPEESLEVAAGYHSLVTAYLCGHMNDVLRWGYMCARDLHDKSVCGRGGLDLLRKWVPAFLELLQTLEKELTLYKKLDEPNKERVCQQLFTLGNLQGLVDYDLALKTLNEALIASKTYGLKELETDITRHIKVVRKAKVGDFSGKDEEFAVAGPDYSKRKPSAFASKHERQVFYGLSGGGGHGRDPTVVCDICAIL